mgnify:CR=1 FL=1
MIQYVFLILNSYFININQIKGERTCNKKHRELVHSKDR